MYYRRMQLPVSLGHLESQKIRDIAGYWLQSRNGRPVPKKADIDAARIPWALPLLFLCSHVEERGDFRYRIVGGEIRDILNRPMTGKLLSEVMSLDSWPAVAQRYSRVIGTPSISHSIGAVYSEHGRHLHGERVVFPLSSDGTAIDMILGMTVVRGPPPPGSQLSSNPHIPTTYTPLSELPESN